MKFKDFFEKNKKFITDIIFVTGISALASFLNYLLNIYLSTSISEFDFGIYSTALGIIYLIQVPAIAIQAGITKTAASNLGSDLTAFTRKSLIQFTVFGLLVTVVFLILGPSVLEYSGMDSKYLFPLAIVVFSAIVSPLAKGFLYGLQKSVLATFIVLVETIIRFGTGFLVVKYSMGITPVILGSGAQTLLLCLIILPFIKFPKVKPEKTPKLDFKDMALMFTSFGLLNMPYTLDLILVNPSIKAEYSALSLLGKIVYFGSIMIASVMFARISAQKNLKEKRRSLLIGVVMTLIVGLSLSVLYFFFKDFLVSFIYKGRYSDIIPYLGFFGLAMTGYAITYMITNYYMALGRYFHLWVLGLTTVLQIGLFFWRNISLEDAFFNQMIVYVVLTVGITLITLIDFLKKGD